MASPLLSVDELVGFLGGNVREADHPALEQVIDGLAGLLARATGDSYLKAGAVVDEPLNGTGRSWLWLTRPATALTSVKIGRDLALPDDTLDVADPDDVVIDPQHARRLWRPLGQTFPLGIRNVHVSYTAASNVPEAATAAVRDAAAFIWRRRGSEDAGGESIGSFNHQVLKDLDDDVPSWRAYIRRHQMPQLA